MNNATSTWINVEVGLSPPRLLLQPGKKWEVGSGKWEVGNGKWEMGSGKWEVGNGKWEMWKLE
ncbi:MAG: hypothetical protein H6566_09130 [Lewinellaceae bacterium]|nr:hypothetical protein [Lewinellaceae bacterium]